MTDDRTVARQWRAWSCSVEVVIDAAHVTAPSFTIARAEAIVRDLMADVAASASRFDRGSDIERVNADSGSLVPVRPLTMQLVGVSVDAARRTAGAVDPTVGTALRAAGYDRDIEAVRAGAPVRVRPPEPRAVAGWETVVLDHELRRVGVPAGVRLDLGATAKAWAADEAARRVAASLGTSALVAIGGDVAIAASPDGRSHLWQVEITERENASDDGQRAQQVGLTHGGVATSSTTARTWLTTAGPAHHLIDPRTGLPTTGRIRTATVWAPTCWEANTWSTAALVWGDAAEQRLADAGVAARLVTDTGSISAVGAWPAATEDAA